jgi:hypothetical protein
MQNILKLFADIRKIWTLFTLECCDRHNRSKLFVDICKTLQTQHDILNYNLPLNIVMCIIDGSFLLILLKLCNCKEPLIWYNLPLNSVIGIIDWSFLLILVQLWALFTFELYDRHNTHRLKLSADIGKTLQTLHDIPNYNLPLNSVICVID